MFCDGVVDLFASAFLGLSFSELEREIRFDPIPPSSHLRPTSHSLTHTYQTTTVRQRVNKGRRGKQHRWTDEGGQSFSLPAFFFSPSLFLIPPLDFFSLIPFAQSDVAISYSRHNSQQFTTIRKEIFCATNRIIISPLSHHVYRL